MNSPQMSPHGGPCAHAVRFGRILALVLLELFSFERLRAGGVEVDDTFRPATDFRGSVRSLLVQPDGKLLVGREFSFLAGVPVLGLVRLLPDGSRDPSFFRDANVSGRSTSVASILRLADGKLLIGGTFDTYGTVQSTNLIRLLPNGEPDPTYPGSELASITGVTDAVVSITALESGDVLVATSGNVDNLSVRAGLIRLDPTGRVRTDWTPLIRTFSGGAWIRTALGTTGDTVYFAGSLSNFEGSIVTPAPEKRTVARFGTGLGVYRPDGTLPPLSEVNIVTEWDDASALAQRPDGRVIAAGSHRTFFSTVGLLGHAGLDGKITPIPRFEADQSVQALSFDPDGSLLIGGQFQFVNRRLRSCLARLTPDYRIDECFDTAGWFQGTSSPTVDRPEIVTLARDGSGAVFVGGSFLSVHGFPRAGLVKLKPTAACPPSTVRFSAKVYPARESDGTVEIPLLRNGDNQERVTVRATSTGGTATPGRDYLAVDSEITFEPGERSKILRVNLTTDSKAEPLETIELQLTPSTPNSGAWIEYARIDLADAISSQLPLVADPSFLPPNGGTLLKIQRDGRLIFAVKQPNGDFVLQRFSPMGEVDPSFTPVLFGGEPPTDAVEGSGGTLFVIGTFYSVNNLRYQGLVRILSDGTVDQKFRPFRGVFLERRNNAPSRLFANVVVLPDDTVLVGGDFQARMSDSTVYGLAHLNHDGSVMENYRYPLDDQNPVLSLAAAPDGACIVTTGQILNNGITTVQATRMLRYLRDGTPDPEFSAPFVPAGFEGSFSILPDGRMLLTSANAESDPNLIGRPVVRLNPDGSYDAAFNPATGFEFSRLPDTRVKFSEPPLIWPDGRFSIAAQFNQMQGSPQPGVAVFRPDGTLDADWNLDLQQMVPTPNSLGASFFNLQKVVPDRTGGVYVLARQGHVSTSNTGYQLSYADLGWQHWIRSPFPVTSRVSLLVPLTSVRESGGPIPFQLIRTGRTNSTTRVHVRAEIATDPGVASEAFFSAWYEFAPGQTQIKGQIPLRDDRVVQGNRTFRLVMDFAEGMELSAVSSAFIQVSDEDWTFEFDTNSYRVAELDGSVTLFARLVGTNFPPQVTLVAETHALSAVEGTDFAVVRTNITLFPSFSPSIPFGVSVPIWENPTASQERSFEVRISSETPGAGTGQRPVAQVTIFRDIPAGSPTPRANGIVRALAQQPDGQILVGGEFTLLNGEPRRGIGRLKSDGALDRGFAPSLEDGAVLQQLLVQPDGRILVRAIVHANQLDSRGILIRMNPDGTPDPSFPLVDAPSLDAVAIQPGEGILVSGNGGSVGGVPLRGLRRIRFNGTIDPLFAPTVTGYLMVNDIAIDARGRILVAGAFSQIAGVGRNGLARLLPNGDPDPSFKPENTGLLIYPIRQPVSPMALNGGKSLRPAGLGDPVETPNWFKRILVEANGRIIAIRIRGAGSGIFGSDFPSALALLDDGTADPKFSANSSIFGVFPIDENGSRFQQYDIAQVAGNWLLFGGPNLFFGITPSKRLYPPTLDWRTSFDRTSASSTWDPSFVDAMLVTPSGDLWIGGNFTRFGLQTAYRLARIPAAEISGWETQNNRLAPPQPTANRQNMVLLLENGSLAKSNNEFNPLYVQWSTDLRTWTPIPSAYYFNSMVPADGVQRFFRLAEY